MALQRKRRPQDDAQQAQLPVTASPTGLFAKPEIDVAGPESGDFASNETTTLEQHRQQASSDGGFNFGNTALFANTPAKAVQRSPHQLILQPKLTVGPVGDKYEQEADSVASQVVDTINQPQGDSSVQREDDSDDHSVQRQPVVAIQRMGPEEEDDMQMKPTLQKVGHEGGAISSSLESEIQGAKGSGQALDSSLQHSMGQAMGADFSGVKIHTDAHSDQLNQSIQAKAFTTGQDVFFRQGEYNPESKSGQQLIAHELTHVVQQGGGIQRQQASKPTQIIHASPQKGAIQRTGAEAVAKANELKPKKEFANWKAVKVAKDEFTAEEWAIISTLSVLPDGNDPKHIQMRRKYLERAKKEKKPLDPAVDKAEVATDVVESTSETLSAGGITGDSADVAITTDVPDNYNSSEAYGDLSDKGAAKLNNPAFDLLEGGNIGLGVANLIGASKAEDKTTKVAQTLDAVGQIGHGGAKATKGIGILANNGSAKASADYTQVGDVGAALADGLGTLSSVLMFVKNVRDANKKSEKQGGLTSKEKIDSRVKKAVNFLDATQSATNTVKDAVKVGYKIGGSPSNAAKELTSSLAQGAAAVGIVIGSIQVIHGAYQGAQALISKGRISEVKEAIRSALIEVFVVRIPGLKKEIAYSLDLKECKELETQIEDLKTEVNDLKVFYDKYAPVMDAMQKLESRRMEQAGMKMAQGTIGIVSSALVLSGVGAPIALGVAAIGGILALGNVVLNWRRNKASDRLTSIANLITDGGDLRSKPIDDDVKTYEKMEDRVYKCYYRHLPEVMKNSEALPPLSKAQFTDVKNFAWADKKKRLKKDERYDVPSLGAVNRLSDLIKKEHWIQVKRKGHYVSYKEKPKNWDKVGYLTSASAHKSEAAFEASAETIAAGLYALGKGSYNEEDQSFIPCEIVPVKDQNIDMAQVKGQTSAMLLKVADINAQRWQAWLEKTGGDPDKMIDMIKLHVQGKKASKVKGKGGKSLRSYE